uniref:Uncharacterized protein n=1 Tax=Romanomermis culicivorax TaxID=13658 RepID=A0A915KNB8_ROMCU
MIRYGFCDTTLKRRYRLGRCCPRNNDHQSNISLKDDVDMIFSAQMLGYIQLLACHKDRVPMSFIMGVYETFLTPPSYQHIIK